MKSSLNAKLAEQGRAIAQGIQIAEAQKQKNMARAEKRSNTMLENAAEAMLSGNYKQGRGNTAPVKNNIK